MNNNFTAYEAERISEKYRTREVTALDELRALDTKVKRPANVFAYTFGAIGAIVMGSGMSLVMTDIGATLGIESNMIAGIAVGVVGMVMSLVNYPIYKQYHLVKKEPSPEQRIWLFFLQKTKKFSKKA